MYDTFDGWKAKGRGVIKGQKMVGKTNEGKGLFHIDQTTLITPKQISGYVKRMLEEHKDHGVERTDYSYWPTYNGGSELIPDNNDEWDIGANWDKVKRKPKCCKRCGPMGDCICGEGDLPPGISLGY